MLIGFTFENFKSFYNETSLSMCASADNAYNEINTFTSKSGKLLKNILIYGANANGKSNLIKAIKYMRDFVTASIDKQIELITQCQAFLFKMHTQSEAIKFKSSFIKKGIIYDYEFEILNKKINYECLYKKNLRNTLVFERTSPNWKDIKITSSDMDNIKKFINNTREDVLFITWAAFINNELAKNILDFFSSIKVEDGDSESFELAEHAESDYIDRRIEFLKKADKNITDMDAVVSDKLNFYHKFYTEKWEECDAIPVSFIDYASKGTKQLFMLSDTIIETLDKGKILVIDEIDNHLHPALVRHIISLFNSIENNPKNAQLICTTHDVLLLDEDIRRDQVWFVDKDDHGISNLYSLSDFKDVHKNSDVLKRYLLGVYGAIPMLDRGRFNE